MCPVTGKWLPPGSFIQVTSKGPSQLQWDPSSLCCKPLPLTGVTPKYTLAGKPRNPQVLSPPSLLSEDPGIRRTV